MNITLHIVPRIKSNTQSLILSTTSMVEVRIAFYIIRTLHFYNFLNIWNMCSQQLN